MTPIHNDEELVAAVWEANSLLQSIADYAGDAIRGDARLQFPRGVIRTAEEGRQALGFVRDKTLRTNLAYQLMLADVYFWILFRTDLSGTARDQLVKALLILGAGMAEAILHDYYDGKLGKRQKFTPRTRCMVEDGTIDEPLRIELNWLWEMRNRQHLQGLGSEFNTYQYGDPERAFSALESLVEGYRTRRSARIC